MHQKTIIVIIKNLSENKRQKNDNQVLCVSLYSINTHISFFVIMNNKNR